MSLEDTGSGPGPRANSPLLRGVLIWKWGAGPPPGLVGELQGCGKAGHRPPLLPGPDIKAGVHLLHCSEAPPTLVVASVSVSGGLSSHRSLGEQGRRACTSPAPQPLTLHTSVPQSPPSEVPHCSRDTTAWQRGPQQEGPTPSRTLAFCSHRPLLASHCPPGKLSQPVTPSPWAPPVSVCGPVEVGPVSE